MTDLSDFLPDDADVATLVGRVHDPELGGPVVVMVRDGAAHDVSHVAPTSSRLFEDPSAVERLRTTHLSGRAYDLAELLDAFDRPEHDGPRLLAPCDLQVIKAAGVTFVESMLERVIEEQVKGDPSRAAAVRARIEGVVGDRIASVVPGSKEAERVKSVLVDEGLWSQYLEVGIGPDPEIFTKAPILSAVGSGEPIGVLRRSTWNNPEPEVVLAVTPQGRPVGATLGNDVNLRDFEGRSALLLTEAKDNNASCAVGPFVRLFDDHFDLDDVRGLEIRLRVEGRDGFVMDGTSSMARISRDPLQLVSHAHGPHHQYPDGFMLFTGTLFSPTQDRHEEGGGFTHHDGDLVVISNPALGSLANRVMAAEDAPRWDFGVWDLMTNLAARGLLGSDHAPAHTVTA